MRELNAEKQRVRRTDASAENVKVKCERVKPRGQGERLLVVGNLHVRKSTLVGRLKAPALEQFQRCARESPGLGIHFHSGARA